MSNNLLVDDNESSTPGDLEQLKQDLAEDKSQPEGGASSNDSADKPTDDIPEKYRGKSITDVISMHQNAESELGRKGNELNQFKQMTDSLLDLKRRNDLAKGGATEDQIEAEPLPEITSSELLENPTDALGRILDARDKSNASKREREDAETEKAEIAAKFQNDHPDATEIANSPDFIKWVGKSTSRSLLGYQAAQGDLVAGDALLTEWKTSTGTTITDDDPTTTEDLKVTVNSDSPALTDARRATTESTGASTTDTPSGKTYRRLDLIRLKLEDPEAYGDEGFQQEIMKAYAEGRVK
jgi:hypothetical protein